MTHILVIGAGPAGLAAAVAASDHGARVTLVDASADVGGQFWRHLPADRAGADERRVHHHWDLLATLRGTAEERTELLRETQVWSWEPDASAPAGCAVNLATGPADAAGMRMSTIRPDAVIIATGAHDRTLPVPGWDLPGVFTGGAAQALAKAERVRIGERVVVSGAGPFLLPVAASIAETGGRVMSVHEASGLPSLTRGWLTRPWGLVGAAGKAAELVEYAGGFVRHRIPYRLHSGVVAIEGDTRVEAVVVADLDGQWRPIPGSRRRILADAVCLTHGFTPRLELAVAAGCHLADGFVAVDAWQATSVPHVFAAGEVTGIGGVDLALAEGAVAGWAAAVGVVGRESKAPAAIRAALRRRARFRDFAARLQAAHGIAAGWQRWLREDTIVCRCEEVTAGDLRAAALEADGSGLRALRLATRAGLGICQARICGQSAEDILIAARGGAPLVDTGDGEGQGATAQRRPIVTPQRLADLAAYEPAGVETPPHDSPTPTGDDMTMTDIRRNP